MKTIWGIAFGVVCGILGVGLLLLATRDPPGEPIRLLPPPTESPLVVQVMGEVRNPGVYNLPRGSRVHNAIQAAGGLVENADMGDLNLARLLEDGDQIRVGVEVKDRTGGDLIETEMPLQNAVVTQLININSATQVELESLPGIGPVRAQAILQYRQENGFFDEIEGLQKVPGIGPATFEQLKDLITIGVDASD
jgi:competence protein ComEA